MGCVCVIWWKQLDSGLFLLSLRQLQSGYKLSLIFFFFFILKCSSGRDIDSAWSCPLFEVSTYFLILADLDFDDQHINYYSYKHASSQKWDIIQLTCQSFWKRERVVSTGTMGWTWSLSRPFISFSRHWSLPCTPLYCLVSHFPSRDQIPTMLFLSFSAMKLHCWSFSFGILLEIAALLYIYTCNLTIFWIRFETCCLPESRPIRLCLENYIGADQFSWLPSWWQNRGQTNASAPYPSTTT